MEPDYNPGDPPSLMVLVIGSVAVFVLLLVLQSCVFG